MVGGKHEAASTWGARRLGGGRSPCKGSPTVVRPGGAWGEHSNFVVNLLCATVSARVVMGVACVFACDPLLPLPQALPDELLSIINGRLDRPEHVATDPEVQLAETTGRTLQLFLRLCFYVEDKPVVPCRSAGAGWTDLRARAHAQHGGGRICGHAHMHRTAHGTGARAARIQM
jgi:hypothetical protein